MGCATNGAPDGFHARLSAPRGATSGGRRGAPARRWHGCSAALFVLRIVGIGWGLPASDGWDNDGVAPRDFLAGLRRDVTPGHFTTYPPRAPRSSSRSLTAPVTIVALAPRPALAPADVIHGIIRVPYMTTIASSRARSCRSRCRSASCGRGEARRGAARAARAGWCAAAFVGVNAPLTYYSHTSNLDVPYLFWGCLAPPRLVRAFAAARAAGARRAIVFAALAVGTKDQAYALFLLGAAAALASGSWLDRGRRPQRRAILPRGRDRGRDRARRRSSLVDGALTTPPASALACSSSSAPPARTTRVHERLGRSLAGRARLAVALRPVTTRWPSPSSSSSASRSLRYAASGATGRASSAASCPLLAWPRSRSPSTASPAGPTTASPCPQYGRSLGVYGGIAVERARLRGPALAPRAGSARLTVAAALRRSRSSRAWRTSTRTSSSIPATTPRRGCAAHGGPGETIETYGLNVYMPRFPPAARVVRVGPDPGDHRNPLPGVEEVLAPFGEAQARGPRYIVVSAGMGVAVPRRPRRAPPRGTPAPPTQRETETDAASTAYFQALTRSRYGSYRLVYVAEWKSRVWAPLEIHASTSREDLDLTRGGGRADVGEPRPGADASLSCSSCVGGP